MLHWYQYNKQGAFVREVDLGEEERHNGIKSNDTRDIELARDKKRPKLENAEL